MNFNFQPSGKCGNCYWFRRSEKKDNIVTDIDVSTAGKTEIISDAVSPLQNSIKNKIIPNTVTIDNFRSFFLQCFIHDGLTTAKT